MTNGLRSPNFDRNEGMQGRNQSVKTEIGTKTQHPDAFHVCGPRNVPSVNWRDLINSSWKDGNYKRTVIACFIQAVYLLELDRQENRADGDALAPKWWTPFKYKLIQTLIDERDGSFFGAVFEWDRAAAMADFVLVRPNGAPRAVLALRGTLLRTPTIRRDVEDDLRFLAWESLKGSVRFSTGLNALRSICVKYGRKNVCIGGHSLGAGFALQVGKELAKEGIFVEAHLFNPPAISLSSGLKNVGEMAGDMWRRVRSMLPLNGEAKGGEGDEGLRMVNLGTKQWIPNLYVNNSDYICCYYSDGDGAGEGGAPPRGGGGGAVRLFVMSKGKFLEAHRLEQWWSNDLEVQMAVNNSKLISRQLKSLYSLPTSEQSPSKN